MERTPETASLHPLLPRAFDILSRLVSFDTTSRNSNLELIAYVKEILAQHNVSYTLLKNAEGTKASLFATIGPETGGGVVLSGHTDVVPVDGQEWHSEPFTLTVKDNKWYGRGTADMKGFLACCLALLPHFAAAKPSRPVHLAFSYDEEIGCLAAPELARHIRDLPFSPAFAIIGEPTLMRLVGAHKGVCSFETIVTGREGHSSAPERGVNAIVYAMKLAHYLTALAEALQHAPHRAADGLFDPPYTTIHVGVMQGGTARNIIPGECRLCWEIRPLPGVSVDALLARIGDYARTLEEEMRRTHAQCSIVTRSLSRVPGLHGHAENSPHTHGLMTLLNTNRSYGASFATEAGTFQTHGLPAFVRGPGSIDCAHQPDEYIEAEQISACLAFLEKIGTRGS